MKDRQPTYFAIIPANVRYNKNIPDGAKLLYGEITALCNQKGYCFATNAYFADLYGKSQVTISRWFSSLAKEGFIRVDISEKDNHTRKVFLSLALIKNDKAPLSKMIKPLIKNDKHNNTSNNKENNNINVNPLQDRQKDSKDLLIRECLEAINKELSKFGKSLVIPQDDKQLKKYYAYKDVKYTIKEYKATAEQWVKIITHKGQEWRDTENFKHLNTTTIKRHFSRYLEDSNNSKGVTSGKDTSESFKKHSKWQDLYKKAQSIAPSYLKADKAKIDNWCLRYLDKYGVGVEEGVNRFDELIKNK